MKELSATTEGELSEGAKESIRLIQAEAEKIISEDIKDFTYSVLSETDPSFWTSPASSTGKYHPEEDNGEGGLVRHVVKAVAVGLAYADRAKFSPRERDIMLSAILLHDTCKGGVIWSGKGTDYTHGFIAAKWLENKFEMDDLMAKQEIANAVRYHMAPWCYAVDPFVDRTYSKQEMQDNLNEIARAMFPSKIEKAVQEADYWSSRKSMSFFPGRTIDFSDDHSLND